MEDSRPEPRLDDDRPRADKQVGTLVSLHRSALPDTPVAVLGNGLVGGYYRWLLDGIPGAVSLTVPATGTAQGFLVGGPSGSSWRDYVRHDWRKVLWVAAVHPRRAVDRRVRRCLLDGRQAEDLLGGDAADVFWIRALGVLPADRRHGIATSLVSAAEVIAREQGCRRIVCLLVGGPAGKDFFGHLGWNLVGGSAGSPLVATKQLA